MDVHYILRAHFYYFLFYEFCQNSTVHCPPLYIKVLMGFYFLKESSKSSANALLLFYMLPTPLSGPVTLYRLVTVSFGSSCFRYILPFIKFFLLSFKEWRFHLGVFFLLCLLTYEAVFQLFLMITSFFLL